MWNIDWPGGGGQLYSKVDIMLVQENQVKRVVFSNSLWMHVL